MTSRFGVAGTMMGLALSAVIVTVVADTLKVYLARVPGAVTKIPGGVKKKSPGRRLSIGFRLPFSRLTSLAPARRGYILGRNVIAMVIVFLIGLVVVTGLELGVGKDLSCWVWNDCASASSADGGTASKTSNTYTLPSILGGGASKSSSAPEGGPSNPQQPAPPATPGTPSQPSNAPGSKTPAPSAQPGLQQSPSGSSDSQPQSPSGAPDNQSQQSPSGSSNNQPQSPSSGTSDNNQQQSPSQTPDNQQQNPSSGTPDNQSQSSPNNSGGGNQQAPPSSSAAPQGSADQPNS